MIDSRGIRVELEKMVGGPGFEPGASRSRKVISGAERFESRPIRPARVFAMEAGSPI
jgi:hypothetical protein